MSQDVWTVAELAERAKVNEKTIRRAIDRGELQAAPLGEDGALRILEEWFQEWMAARARLHAERRASRSTPAAAVASGGSRRPRQRGRLTVHEGMGKRA